MSFQSRREYPSSRIPDGLLLDKINHYKSSGLTMEEASDMATFEQVEFRGGTLSPEEQQRKEAYEKKMASFKEEKK